jgi:hypothetical protein
LSFINKGIEKRNAQRRAYASILENPSDRLLKKLAAARSLKVDTRLLSEEKAIFTTERDSLEQEFDASP